MGFEIANIESYVKYAGATKPRTPLGNELRKFYSGDKASVDSFIKSLTKPKIQLPNDVVNSAAKTFKADAFCKIAQGSPRPFINKMNLSELFTKATKFIKIIK